MASLLRVGRKEGMESPNLESPPGYDKTLWPPLTDEEWRPISWTDGTYWVSNWSRVWTIPKKVRGRSNCLRQLKGRVLKPTTDKKNHLYVGIRKDGKDLYRYVHRLALSAFQGDRPYPEWEACHRDDNPENNHISNLYWGSRSDNAIDMMDNKRHPATAVDYCKHHHRRGYPNLPRRHIGTRNRACLACERARGYLMPQKPYSTEYFEKVADKYYEDIMKESNL